MTSINPISPNTVVPIDLTPTANVTAAQVASNAENLEEAAEMQLDESLVGTTTQNQQNAIQKEDAQLEEQPPPPPPPPSPMDLMGG